MKRKNRICFCCARTSSVQLPRGVCRRRGSEGARHGRGELPTELTEQEQLPYEAGLIDISGAVNSVIEALKKKDSSTYISKFKTKFETILAIVRELKEKGLISSKIAQVKGIVEELAPELKKYILSKLVDLALEKIEKVKKAAKVIEMIAALPLEKITTDAKGKIQAAA